MKRIKYISRFSRPISDEEIGTLVARAAKNNAALDITGVLMTSGQLFFQVLEGPEEAIDDLFREIAADPRHQDVLLVKEERGVNHRIFPDWSMRAVTLDSESVARLEPLRVILETAAELRGRVNVLAGTLQRGLWTELSRDSPEG